MKAKYLFFILLSQVFFTAATGQDSKNRATGTWMGHLHESAMDLRLVFNISASPDGTLSATLDSPDQSVEGLKMGNVTINDTLFFIDTPMLNVRYKGTFVNDSLVKGVWSQGAKEYDLDLMKLKGPIAVNRPQEPKPPFPYRSEEVVFRNTTEDFDLAGTLTIPEGPGPFPAVILISGSGYQDRDETIFNHKPFLVISDYLTRNGIAVLRYDDRATGESKGNKTNATTETLAGDARSALEYLKTRSEIDSTKTGLAGHSEGGIIAAIVAAENDDVAFVISLAGPGVRGDEVLLKQTADISLLSGGDTAAISEEIRVKKHLFELLASEPDQKMVTRKAFQWYAADLDAKGIGPDKRQEELSNFAKTIVAFNGPWFRYFLSTDPKLFWEKVSCPVLALNGEKDIQVNHTVNLDAIKTAMKKGGNKKAVTMSFSGLNHLFQHCNTGLPTEYATIDETFSSDVLIIIAEWIEKTVNRKR